MGESPEDAIHYLPGESDNGMFGGNSIGVADMVSINYLNYYESSKISFFMPAISK
jgi:hypothetical protein